MYECVLCKATVEYTHGDFTLKALKLAAESELDWHQHPVEVAETQCKKCGIARKWWWFTE